MSQGGEDAHCLSSHSKRVEYLVLFTQVRFPFVTYKANEKGSCNLSFSPNLLLQGLLNLLRE